MISIKHLRESYFKDKQTAKLSGKKLLSICIQESI